MKSISVLVTHNALIAAIGNTRYLFGLVNDFLKQSGQPALFDVKVVGVAKKMKLSGGLYIVQPDAIVEEVEQTDLIIIPPMSGEMESGISLNKKYISWIRQQYQRGAEVASLCVGAFLLAETGLLRGRQCSSHWQSAPEFRKRYPDVHLVDDKIITDHNGLYTSGGANSYWNLLVYLVEKYTSRTMAIRTSKYFEVEMDRDTQSPFKIFEGNKLHDDKLVECTQKFIESHYQDKLTIEQLAALANLSRRTFHRRFKKATHFTVGEYIQRVKIEAAKQMLEADGLTVNEVMFQVGYHDPKAFRDIFRKVAGMSPMSYKNRYHWDVF
ncbi:GlxA family transcriptional regulator [Catalinimonas niigatensis]|uniref:GlxA family transcriptional regulator n=1 Tax=Catalinimonas niigatensis TaxID=1397264 RepID=UPI00266718A4|nr:helix-turn-helix domain-containing protein [Catalinimonas niigatensis]WPP51942.1 helix-turn-helix domain-containing protein [Catalinimonas niigatensis]